MVYFLRSPPFYCSFQRSRRYILITQERGNSGRDIKATFIGRGFAIQVVFSFSILLRLGEIFI
ncbi:hypothetical protein OVS_04065 [Mycoplasma ovis str. Michigan]|uniref:Uncharacterized protein n=1 Tax=Mycoplasma ovis str. Michigan TaxID=1415773 RepID=A0ABM5P250_9MOLU|nr:hypothetical protein OVS_04065 [Mycoplasma ovis str. Michigan]